MIKRKADLTVVPRNIHNGNGEVITIPLLTPEEFSGKGKVFSKMILPPGTSIGDHQHKADFEGFYILKGEGIFLDNGKEVIVSEGDFTLTTDGESHSLKNDSQEDLEFIALLLFS